MQRSRLLLKLSACFVLSLCLFSIGYGQETWGSVRGNVTDPSGAAIPGAQVELSGTVIPQPFKATSDASGAFRFAQVPPGPGYSVSVIAQGFRNAKVSNINVEIGKAVALDLKMEVGQVSESVMVSAESVMVDTQSSSSAVTVDKTFFDLIPKGRSFYDLIAIAPGARQESKTGGVQVDGASGSENTYYIDGMEVTDIQSGILRTQSRIPVEAIQQMQVKNGVMEAQYGGAMGGVVSAVVRSGSNEIHGQAGFYFDNDALSARPRPTLRLSPTDPNRMTPEYFQNPMDSYRTWNPVFNIGGPLIKNKLFFFSGYMPTTTTTERTVNFVTGQTGNYSTKFTQHYLANKIDYVPFSKVRMNMSWIWNPYKNTGLLPARGGTDSYTSPWADFGNRRAGNILAGQIDYMPSAKLVASFRGGYHYTNYTDMYAIPSDTYIIYNNSNVGLAGVPSNLQRASGTVSYSPPATSFDIYRRVNLNADVSYLFNWAGQHSLKGGWQRNQLGNNVNYSAYANGYYRYYWNTSYRCVTSQCSGAQRGSYGYYRYRSFGTFGDVSSNNTGLFLQDTWRVSKRLTLNLGLRTEREVVPSFAVGNNIPSSAIEFNWPDKMSPRLGFAYDPTGKGRMKIYGSWGYFYDIMKYSLPRGSFGGDVWKDYFYALDDPTLVQKNLGIPANPRGLTGKLFEVIDWRIPSNDPSDNTIDPALKPTKTKLFDLGYDLNLTSSMVASVRYTNRRMVRTIEDVGTLGPDGEIYYIANPGFGLTVDPKTWDTGFPVTPKAKRNYDAVEFRIDRRFTTKYQFSASYTWSRLFGNYSGLASSDELDASGVGRTDPSVSRYFDLPWIGYNEQGKFAEGRLATDRPHTFKFFGGYTHSSRFGSTTLSPNVYLYSGTPLTTQLNAISSVPVYPYGRGDLGRTPFFKNFDLNLVHDFKPFSSHESIKMRFEFSVFNLFNNGTVVGEDTTYLHPDDGQLQFANDVDIFKGYNAKAIMARDKQRVNPTFGYAQFWQSPRTARLQFSFFF